MGEYSSTSSYIDSDQIPLLKLYTIINQMPECIWRFHETEKTINPFLDIAYPLKRLIALKEFKNIFRNCLKLIYSNCPHELDDILDIEPYKIEDIIET